MSSFGETLKRERELRQISLREISEATKINLRYLDALERNEFRHLPGGVFNKGFVRAFAQYIGIDADAMVESYLDEMRSQEARAQDRENARDRARRVQGEPRPVWTEERGLSRGARWLVVGGGLLLAAAAVLGIYLFRHRQPAAPGGPTVGTPAQSSRAATLQESPIEPNPVPAAAAQAASEGSAAALPPATAQPSPAPLATQREGFSARIVVDRPVRGSISCDGRVVHLLESLPQGALLDLQCRESLVLDADDGGALRIGVNGAEPVAPGPSGVPLVNHRIAVPVSAAERPAVGTTP